MIQVKQSIMKSSFCPNSLIRWVPNPDQFIRTFTPVVSVIIEDGYVTSTDGSHP